MPQGHVVVREFAGLNLLKPARHLEDNELAHAKNVWQPVPGVLGLRPQTKAADMAFWDANDGRTTAVMPLLDANNQTHLYAWVNRDNNPARLTEATEGVPTLFKSLTTKVTSETRPGWVAWRNRLYVFPGPGGDVCGYVVDGRVDSLTIQTTDAGASWSQKIKPRLAVIHRSQLVLAGMDTPEDSTIVCSEVNDPASIVAEAKYIWCGKGDGDSIVGMVSVPVVGGGNYAEPYLLVFKQRSTWLVSGALPTPSVDNKPAVTLYSGEAGLAAKETLAWTEHGLMWASGDNVWLAPRGGMPTRIGDAIAPALRSAPAGGRWKWSAAYFNQHYRLSIVSVEGGHYDWPDVQYWCDMRDPEHPKWFGPMTVPVTAQTVWRRPGYPDRLVMAYVDTSGNANLIADGDYGTAGHLDAHDSSNAATIDLKFKEFDFGDPMLDKLIQALELHLWVDKGGASALTIDMLADGGRVVQSQNKALTEQGFVLDTSVLDTGVLTEEFQSVVAYPPNAGRFIGKTWQPRIRTNSASGAAPEVRIAGLGVRARVVGRRPA